MLLPDGIRLGTSSAVVQAAVSGICSDTRPAHPPPPQHTVLSPPQDCVTRRTPLQASTSSAGTLPSVVVVRSSVEEVLPGPAGSDVERGTVAGGVPENSGVWGERGHVVVVDGSGSVAEWVVVEVGCIGKVVVVLWLAAGIEEVDVLFDMVAVFAREV